MKNFAFLFLASTLLFSSCKKIEINGDVPDCVEKMIKEEANSVESQFDEVWEYDFQGSKVYAFVQALDIADGQTLVYNEDCTPLCTLGGIAGIGICNGDTFSQATNAVLVWSR